jgi:signal peptidase II
MFRDGKKVDFLFISVAILVLDQWTKWLVEVHLPHAASHPLIPGFLNVTHVRNTGVAFGLFASHGADGGAWLLVVMGLVALAAVFLYFRFAPARNRLLLAALALIVGGAVGNLIDRLASGAVTDFVDVYVGSYHWPAFNVADSAITVGIGLMILDSFRSPGRGESPAEAAGDRAAASQV